MTKSIKDKVDLSRVIVVAGLAVLAFSGCNERVPGCLDIQAENFDFDAEKNDPSLCTYPDLILNVFYQWDTTFYSPDSLYYNDIGKPFVVHSVQIMFSDFILKSVVEDEFTVIDMVTLRTGDCESGTDREVPDDFVFVDRSKVNYVLGEFRESDQMAEFRMIAGVREDYLPVCPDNLPSNHPLRNIKAGYRPDSGDFAIGRFIVSQDSINAARDTFFIYDTPDQLSFDVSRGFHLGKPDTIYLSIDFAHILNPVDWTQNEQVVTELISAGIPGAVTVR